MFWIVKMVWIVASIVQGQITVPPIPEVQAPVIVEDTVTVEEVWVATPDTEVYPDFRVVEMVDGQGVVAQVPDLPATVSPEDSWAMFWALNPEIKEMVDNNNGM
jgi:hypothetical protein